MCHSNAPRPIPGSRLNATWHRGEWFVSNVSPDIFTPASPLSDEKVGSNKEGRWWETRGYSNGSHMTQQLRAFAPPLNSSNECVAGPYWADHTRLTIMFIQDGHGEPGDESGVGRSLSTSPRTRIPSETKSSRGRGPGSADDQINPPGADLDSQIGWGAF